MLSCLHAINFRFASASNGEHEILVMYPTGVDLILKRQICLEAPYRPTARKNFIAFETV